LHIGSGALAVGAHGVITGIANFFPRVILKLYDLFKQGKLAEATKLQGEVSAGEWGILASGIPSMKVPQYITSRLAWSLPWFTHRLITQYATQLFRGYGGVPRRPLPPSPQAAQEKVQTLLTPLSEIEKNLEAQAKGK
jgi:4-hydroxy-2-oxoglutarate aldolase